jgi:hypothetical protein
MEDEIDNFITDCTDLVTLRQTESFPLCLLKCRSSGEWFLIKEVCQEARIGTTEVRPYKTGRSSTGRSSTTAPSRTGHSKTDHYKTGRGRKTSIAATQSRR